jgi:hypothetical protein
MKIIAQNYESSLTHASGDGRVFDSVQTVS